MNISKPVTWFAAAMLGLALIIAVDNPDARGHFFQTLQSNGGGTALAILAGALATGTLWRNRTPETLRKETATTLKAVFLYVIAVLLISLALLTIRAFKEPKRDPPQAVSSVVNDPQRIQAPVAAGTPIQIAAQPMNVDPRETAIPHETLSQLNSQLWILVSVAHSGKPETQPEQYLGAYATEGACEHMLTALSDPAFKLKTAKPTYMSCVAEQPK